MADSILPGPSHKRNAYRRAVILTPAVLIVAGLLYLSSTYSYLLFHTLVESAAITVGFSVFVIAWNTRRYVSDHFIVFLGIAYLFISIIQLLHMLAYQGMGIFTGYDANLPAHLWIAARYLEATSWLAATFLIGRRIRLGLAFGTYATVAVALLLAIFGRTFPDCFIEGSGPTPFKIISEYLICLIIAGAIYRLYRRRSSFDSGIWYRLSAAMTFTILAELTFVIFNGGYGLPDLLGRFFIAGSVVMLYRAVIFSGLTEPFGTIFQGLQRSESRLRAVLDSASDAIIAVDEQERLTIWNHAAASMFGYSADEIIGQPRTSIVAEKDRKASSESMRRALTAGRLANPGRVVEGLARRKDGTEFPTESTYAMGQDKRGAFVIQVTRDITERKKAEEALRFRAEIVENMSEAVIIADEDLRAVSWNKAAERMYGWTAAEAIGKKIPDLLKTRYYSGSQEESVRVLRDGGVWRGEIVHIRKDGTPINVMACRSRFRDASGKFIGSIAINTDITAVREAEKRARETEELDRLKSNILQTVSHELRTPMTIAQGYASILLAHRQRLDIKEQDWYLKEIENSIQGMASLVERLVEISRLQSGVMEFVWFPVNLAALLNEAAESARNRFPRRRISVLLDVPETEAIITGDATRIRDVIDNLLDNARQFSPEDTPITIRLLRVGDELVTSFSNQGAGIPPEELERIFQPLHGVERRLNPKLAGLSLGLALCKGIIEAHRGRIWIDSTVGKETTVSFALPVITTNVPGTEGD